MARLRSIERDWREVADLKDDLAGAKAKLADVLVRDRMRGQGGQAPRELGEGGEKATEGGQTPRAANSTSENVALELRRQRDQARKRAKVAEATGTALQQEVRNI
jgi:hypothetical protein